MFTIYSKVDCEWCDKAKALLDARGIFYQTFTLNVHFSPSDFFRHFPDKKTLPQVVDAQGVVIGGYTDLVSYFAYRDYLVE